MAVLEIDGGLYAHGGVAPVINRHAASLLPPSFTSHLIAPSPSYFRKNTSVAFDKMRSNDETKSVFTRWMAPLSVWSAD